MERDTERRGLRKDLVWYLPNIKWFHEEHPALVSPLISSRLSPKSYLPSIKETRVFAEQLLILGTYPVPYKKVGAPNPSRPVKPKMICIFIPFDFGYIAAKAKEKDRIRPKIIWLYSEVSNFFIRVQ
jgi:hypothetical protein